MVLQITKHSISTRAQYHAKSSFSKGVYFFAANVMTLLQNPRGLCCHSSTEACHKFHPASFPTTDTSNTIGPVRLYDPHSRTACTTAWTCCRALSYSGPHSKLAAFRVTRCSGQGNIPRCGMGCLWNPSGLPGTVLPSL